MAFAGESLFFILFLLVVVSCHHIERISNSGLQDKEKKKNHLSDDLYLQKLNWGHCWFTYSTVFVGFIYNCTADHMKSPPEMPHMAHMPHVPHPLGRHCCMTTAEMICVCAQCNALTLARGVIYMGRAHYYSCHSILAVRGRMRAGRTHAYIFFFSHHS